MRYILLPILIGYLLDIKAQNPPCLECSKVVFIIDNSGSIDDLEYSDMKTSINQITSQLLAKNPTIEIAIVQYGTETNTSIVHLYNISVPFTNNLQGLSNYSRVYNSEDHLPGSLGEMRLDNVWDVSGNLDIVSEGCFIKCFVFTDALLETQSCCSYLSNTADAPNAFPNYDEYNYLKSNYNVEFSVYHVLDDPLSDIAGAAISSVGGTYSGAIDNNIGDPQGNGVLPRKYFPGATFLLSQDQIENIVNELTTDLCDSISGLFIPNIFTPNGDGLNDFFYIKKRNISKISGVIYNRWGLKMAQWTDLNYNWDGKSPNGKDASDGTYYFIIKADGTDGKKYQETGFLTLLRNSSD